MFSFPACFWNSDIYVNDKNKYAANEILTAYLNTDYAEYIDDEEFIHILKVYTNRLQISADMDYEDFENYNDNVHHVQRKLNEINEWIVSLPPYNKILKQPLTTLEDVLNRHTFFFEDGLSDDEDISWDTFNEYGEGEVADNGLCKFRLHRFEIFDIDELVYLEGDMLDSLNELNSDVQEFLDEYILFLESYMSAHIIFKPFIDNLLHSKGTFLTSNEIAESFDEFNKKSIKNFNSFKCKMSSFGYKSLKDEDGKQILCEEMFFDDLQSFLYYDFFNGIKKNYVPNQCKNCGRYFLIRSGKYLNYCDTPIADEPDKTCKNVGAKRRYDDKCKNDPIWQTYNRAYKAHYARYMKKKMTVSEFEQWSCFASELRDKALADEIAYEEYYAEIRK